MDAPVVSRENSLREADARHHFHPMTNPVSLKREGATFVEHADGIFVTIDGDTVIDGLSGLGCVNIGYGNRKLSAAAAKAMDNLSYSHSFGGQSNHEAAALSTKLVELTEKDFLQFFFSSTGSDANETAIKMAYYYWRLRGQPQRRMLLSRRHSYHGNTIVATSLTGLEAFHPQFGLPLRGLVRHVDTPYWYRYGRGRSPEEYGQEAAASLERMILEVGAENIAAFIAEPIQGTGGIIIPPDGYWQAVREICDRHDILLIADEVITGFGKVGKMFAYQHLDFKPDLIVLAKGITSGYFPVSAVGVGSKVGKVLGDADSEFEHGFTNCAHPVGAAIALANIGVIEDEKLVENVANDVGPRLAAGLQRLKAHQVVGDVRTLGIMGAVELNVGEGSRTAATALCERVAEEAFKRGLIARTVGPTLVLVLPMIVTVEQIDRIAVILDESIGAN